MHSVLQDIRFALRVIRRQPVTTATIVLTLALGIAANTLMFSSFDSWVLRPLALKDPQTLVTLNEAQPQLNANRHQISAANLRDWQEQSRTLTEIQPFDRRLFNFHDADEPELVQGAAIAAGLFPLIGAEPVLGRNFLAEEDVPDGPRVVLISHRIWQTRFDSDPQILGKTLRLDEEVHEIVGVMAPGFQFPEWADLWTPLGLDPLGVSRDQRRLSAFARLAPGVAIEDARTELQTIAARLEKRHPDTNSGWSASLLPVREEWAPPVIRTALTASLGAGISVLLIICANVANLMLAQASGRQRETALRTALGASRRRLVRQTLTEAALVALVAGGLGALASDWGGRWMVSWVPVEPPYLFHFDFDSRALAYTLVVSLAAGLVCGLAPVLRSSGLDLVEALKSGGRAGEGQSGSRLRGFLVVGELAFSMLLVVVALLMVKSFVNQQQVDAGYRSRDVLTLRLSLTGKAFAEPEDRVAFLDRALTRLGALATVETVGAVNHLPASRSGYSTARLEAEGSPSRRRGQEPTTTVYSLAGDYLDALEIPVAAGRGFTRGEMLDGGDVAIVSNSLAERLWPGDEPLGHRIRTVDGDEPGPWLRVVGVAGDVDPGHSMVDFGGRPKSQLYVPYRQLPDLSVSLAVHSDSPIAPLAEAVRSALREIDSTVPLSDVVTIDRAIYEVQWVSRFFSLLLAVYAAIALAIAALGAYGVTADSVSRRMREMGIRIAVGARRRDILGLVVLRQGLLLGALGVALGLLASLVLTRFLSSMLYQVSATDPVIFGGVALLLAAVAFIASLLPARRASKVDPIEVLRCE